MQEHKGLSFLGASMMRATVILLMSCALVLAFTACDVRRTRRANEQGTRESITTATNAEEGVDKPDDVFAKEGTDRGLTRVADVDLAGITTQEEARRKLTELGIEYDTEQFLEQLRKANQLAFQLFLKGGMDPNVKGEAGVTPLMAAVFGNDPVIVKQLLELGADVRAREEGSEATALHYACQSDPLVQAMGEGPDAPSREQVSEATGWHYEVDNAVEIARLLLEYGADIEARDMAEATPLLIASMQGVGEVAELLIDKGADVGAHDHFERTVLMLSVLGGDLGLMQLLVEKGVDVRATDAKGANALWTAVRAGRTEMIRYLLSRGASVSIESDELWPTIHVAAGGIDPGLFDQLEAATTETERDRGILESVKDEIDNRLEVLELLLKGGADPNLRDPRLSATPLHLAAHVGNLGGMELLLAYGAEVNVYGHAAGVTPLHLAADSGRSKCVRLLLEHGADPAALNNEGHTPLQIAQEGKARTEAERAKLEEELALAGEQLGEEDRAFYARRLAAYDEAIAMLESAASV
jgi:ankyrin